MPFSKSSCTECSNALINIISRCCPFINNKKQANNEVNRKTKLELNENHCDNENRINEIKIKSTSSPLPEKQSEVIDNESTNSPGTSQKQLQLEQLNVSTQAASSSTSSSYSSASATTSKSTKMTTTTTTTTTTVTQSRGPLRHKIVVLGDGGVGKSALTLQFVTHSFLEYHDPTIEDSYQQQSMIDGQTALLDILDTAGQVEFTAMRDQYMRCGDGFIICYSIIDRRSFDEIEQYYRQIHRLRGHENIHLPIVMVGNKCDLEHLRQVSTEEGQSLALKLNCPFFETSAALKHQVEEVFYNLVRLIRDKDENYSQNKTTSSLRALKNWRIVIAVLNFITKRRN